MLSTLLLFNAVATVVFSDSFQGLIANGVVASGDDGVAVVVEKKSEVVLTEPNVSETKGGSTTTYEEDTTSGGTLSNSTTTPLSPKLPRRHIAVFGLESSGTTFFSKLLAKHANVRFREGLQGGRTSGRPQPPGRSDFGMEVLHVSQPWGAACGMPDIRDEVMPAMYPKDCVYALMDNDAFDGTTKATSLLDAEEECVKIGASRTYSNLSKILYYPKRFFVNVTSHVMWYRDRGVDATAVIVSRDKNIGHAARYHGHCSNESKVHEEEQTGLELLSEAMERLPRLYQKGNHSTSPPIVTVSYEQMVLFRDVYVNKVLRKLGLPLNVRGNEPRVSDSNSAYVKSLQAIGEEKKAAKLKSMQKPAKP